MQVLVGVQCSHPSARRGQRPNGAGEKKRARNTVHTACDASCVRPTLAARHRGAPARSESLDSPAYAAPATAGSLGSVNFSVPSRPSLLVARRARLTQSRFRDRRSMVATLTLGLGAHYVSPQPSASLPRRPGCIVARRRGPVECPYPGAVLGSAARVGGSTGRRSGSTPKP